MSKTKLSILQSKNINMIKHTSNCKIVIVKNTIVIKYK